MTIVAPGGRFKAGPFEVEYINVTHSIPEANALAAAVLLMSYFANGTAFLAFAIMAERRGLETTAQGQKSLYYMLGMAEGAETIAVSALFCILPAHFATIAYIYSVVCFASATGRILYARRVLS